MSLESYMKYREYETINQKWYYVNHFVNESIIFLSCTDFKFIRCITISIIWKVFFKDIA